MRVATILRRSETSGKASEYVYDRGNLFSSLVHKLPDQEIDGKDVEFGNVKGFIPRANSLGQDRAGF